MKNFNTFFDYWKGTRKSIVRSGKTLSGWTVTFGHNQIHGGISPTLKAIKVGSGELDTKMEDVYR